MAGYPKQLKILEMLDQDLKSPYADVSDKAWLLAREDACIELGRKGLDREPTTEEIDDALDRRKEEQ